MTVWQSGAEEGGEVTASLEVLPGAFVYTKRKKKQKKDPTTVPGPESLGVFKPVLLKV